MIEIGYGDSQCKVTLEVSPKPTPTAPSQSTPIQLNVLKIPRGSKMSNLENALRELREKRGRAQIEIEKLDQIISGIESLTGASVLHKSSQPGRVISAASRRKMALAQKARWAGLRKTSQPVVAKSTGSAPAKRKISAAGRKKMAEASRARWAKIRAAKKAA